MLGFRVYGLKGRIGLGLRGLRALIIRRPYPVLLK